MVEYINDLGVFQMSWVGALSIARGMETAPTSNRNETHPNDLGVFHLLWRATKASAVQFSAVG